MRYTAESIYRTFRQTEFGSKLSRKARYHRFMPESWSTDQWELLMGPHANNLHHMRQSMTDACWVIDHENKIPLSYREKMLLIIAASMHDQGEAITGDIPYGYKSEEAEDKELEVLRTHENAFLPGVTGGMLDMYREARDNIIFGDKGEKLPSLFAVVELMGYTDNALHALRRLKRINSELMSDRQLKAIGIDNNQDAELAKVALRRLAGEVLGSDVVGRLITSAERFSSAEQYLRLHASEISRGMNSIDKEIFDWYDNEDSWATERESRRRLAKFETQKAAWNKWHRDNSARLARPLGVQAVHTACSEL